MSGAVAITGIAAQTALGDLETTGGAEPPLEEIGAFDASGFGAPRAALLPREAESEEDDPAERILGFAGRALAACCSAAHGMARARDLPREEIGLYVATGMVDSDVADLASAASASRGADGRLDLARFFASGFRSIHPLWPLSMLNNVAAGQVATELDVRGDNLVLASEADAGARAFEEALAAIRAGVVRAALVAGVSERVSPASLARRRLRGAEGAVGEAAATVVLEHPESARARGVEALGYVLGSACAHGDGAAERAVAEAARDAGRSPSSVELVEAPSSPDLGPAAVALLVATWTHAERGAAPPKGPRAILVRGPSGGVGVVVVALGGERS